jgi:hypothetical protein
MLPKKWVFFVGRRILVTNSGRGRPVVGAAKCQPDPEPAVGGHDDRHTVIEIFDTLVLICKVFLWIMRMV